VNNAVNYYQDTMQIGHKGLDGAPVITKPLLQGGIVSISFHRQNKPTLTDSTKGVYLLPRHTMLRTRRRMVLWSLRSHQDDRLRLYLGHLRCHITMLGSESHLDDICQALERIRYRSTQCGRSV